MQKYPIFQLRFVKDLISTDNIFLALLWQHQTRGQAWHPSYDPLHKFRIVLDGLNSSCKWHYVPGQQIAMDESPTGMKNRTELILRIRDVTLTYNSPPGRDISRSFPESSTLIFKLNSH